MIDSSQKIEIDGNAQKRLDTRTKKKKNENKHEILSHVERNSGKRRLIKNSK